MTRKLPLTLTLAALVGFAAPALAAEHGAKHDPQAATTTAKHGKAPKAAKAAKAKGTAKTTPPATQKPAAAPATK